MRKILISGASRGIGRAIAFKLLKEGHSISLGIREKEDLKNTHLDMSKIHNSQNKLKCVFFSIILIYANHTVMRVIKKL